MGLRSWACVEAKQEDGILFRQERSCSSQLAHLMLSLVFLSFCLCLLCLSSNPRSAPTQSPLSLSDNSSGSSRLDLALDTEPGDVKRHAWKQTEMPLTVPASQGTFWRTGPVSPGLHIACNILAWCLCDSALFNQLENLSSSPNQRDTCFKLH